MDKTSNNLNNLDVPSRIKFLRKQKGLTQKQLAEKAGISFSMISKIESGERNNPSLSILEKIAKVIDLTLDDLLGYNWMDNQIFANDILFLCELMQKLDREKGAPVLDMVDAIRLLLNGYPDKFRTVEYITDCSAYIGLLRILTTKLENICLKQSLVEDEDFSQELFNTYSEHKKLINSFLDLLYERHTTYLNLAKENKL